MKQLDLGNLDSFRASGLLAAAPVGAPVQVALELIDFDPHQPRRTINEASLNELAESIRAQGVLEPVSLRSHPEAPSRFIVNRGERRVRASRRAGLVSVPSFIDERVDPYAQVIENLQREDLSPFDLARFIADREAAGECRAEIARRLHKPASFITEAAALAAAPEKLQQAYEKGQVRDTRVLYELSREHRQRPEVVEGLLDAGEPIRRDALADRSKAGDGPAAPGRVVRATKAATALLVEHGSLRGRLALSGHAGKRSGSVTFDNGTQKTVELAELKVIAWTVR